ncbi:MAG TPA: hypothetical protein VIL74_08850 [Pyrinomonadaceae bacterium]|jgi:hypothetical protein
MKAEAYKYKITCPHCAGMNRAETEIPHLYYCKTCALPIYNPAWQEIPAWERKKTPCSACGALCNGASGMCRRCYYASRKARKPSCVDCGKPCTIEGGRCRACRNVFIKGRVFPMHKTVGGARVKDNAKPAPVPSPLEKLKRKLFALDPLLCKQFVRLGKRDPRLQMRAARGLVANINAQVRNARRSGVAVAIDLSPLKEIIDDAGKGNFFFEENMRDRARSAARPTELRTQIEIYFTN